MSRIRTIKPEFFRHEGLQDIEVANPGSYVMLVFAGLWLVADREGRFEWRPRRLKLDVLPFLDFDMERTLNILDDSGLVLKYEHSGETYGAIMSWDRHQIVGRDEPPSEIPAPDGSITTYFRPLNQTQRFKVYERDKWTCAYCERDMKNDRRAACLDHVIPYSKGGTNRDKNLVTSCKRCNAEKNDRTPTEAGFKWPDGLGEYHDKETNEVRQYSVNTPLTGGAAVPDKEGEGEREQEVEREQERVGDLEKTQKTPQEQEKKLVKRATQLPADFVPNETGVAYADSRRIHLPSELESFRNWHAAKGSTMKDWQAAWRTWCDKAVEFGRAGNKQQGGSNGKNGSSRADRISATIAELTGANRHPAPAIDGIAERVD